MKSKKLLVTAGCAAACLILCYIGLSLFFTKHYFFRTTINGQNVSCRTVSDVKKDFEKRMKRYELSIYQKGSRSETIPGSSFSLAYKDNRALKSILDKQQAFLWPKSLFSPKSAKINVGVSYDTNALEENLMALEAAAAGQTPPQSAYPEFNGNQFVIKPEVPGTALDMDRLKEKAAAAVAKLDGTLDLEKEGCYMEPAYTTASKEVQKACDELNRYCSASITYSMKEPVVVDKSLISSWLTVDETMNITMNEDAIREWLRNFGKTYDTLGTTRTLTTPAGKTAQVSGGTYGWSVDEAAELPALINSIKNGEVITREPVYCQTAASHEPQDWGSTYVDVDLTEQYMWYIVDGSPVFECDIITGLPVPDRETPAGVYDILEKLPGKTLIGATDPETGQPAYRTYVDYWMRVTYTGIGFHNADWQPAFGGDLYKTRGSHGCINMSFQDAETFYGMIANGVPVVMHY